MSLGLGSEFEEFVNDDSVKECTICQGRGFIHKISKEKIPCKQPGRFLEKPVVVPCYCKLNQRVEDQFPRLRKSELCLDKQVRDVSEATGMQNYLFIGNRTKFLRMVKSKFIALSLIPGVQYHIANGTEIIKEHYVAQDDKSGRTVLDLMRKWPFLVIVFESRSVNKAMKPVICDIISSRITNSLTTWVWAENSLDSYEEWSPELNKFFNDPAVYKIESLTDSTAQLDLSSLMSKASAKAVATQE